MIGRIHSVQSLGAVDGPGVRFVVFMQGCPLRCGYCHNPDTWDDSGGSEQTVEELTKQILRFQPYFGEEGGITVTGGEPLLQGAFVGALFEEMHRYGIHTALDTSGHGSEDAIRAVLPHTDLVLCDLKFATEEEYQAYTGGHLQTVLNFLARSAVLGKDVWIRHVVVPNLTDSPDYLQQILALCKPFNNIKKVELLPFRTLCVEKYEALGIPFAMKDVPPCPTETIHQLNAQLKEFLF
ncbi:MAG: pyruvate formate lyase-activating protein [Clostridia bacterium]|nr:pyruvate formate lyase-activating protein [Clostridia bacterium]